MADGGLVCDTTYDMIDQSIIFDQNGNRFRRKRSERQRSKGNETRNVLSNLKSSDQQKSFAYQPQSPHIMNALQNQLDVPASSNFDYLQRFDTKESTIR